MRDARATAGSGRHERNCTTATRLATVLLGALLALPAGGQQQPPLPWTTAPEQAKPAAAAPASGSQQAAAPAAQAFKQEELDQLLAPIALYPDALLAQVLMASTYPLDIVSADRWVKANPKLKDKALQDALEKQPWDTSVKSLAVFPQVLAMMSEKLDWTQKLGDAFLAQQKDVLATAQALRKKAQDQGNLKDTAEQKVASKQEGSTTYITIEPTNPEVVYVPTYNPTVVYGSWWYPAYPPYYYYPPGYVAGGALLGFTAGIIVGGALWGNCNWGGGDVNIDIDRHNNFNRTNNISSKDFKHNADRRGGVPYRDNKTAQQYGRGQKADAASRDAFRGRAEAGQQSIQRGDVSSRNFDARSGSVDRGGASDFSGARGGGAFDMGGGAQARDYGSRGSSSMASSRGSGNMSASRASSGMSGGARAGGGGARGGGGGGRGGRR